MTGPIGRSVGSAYADFHLRTSTADDDLKKALSKASDDGEKIMDTTGRKWSKKLTSSMADDIEHEGGSTIRRAFSAFSDKEKIKVKADVDVDNNTITRSATSIARRLGSALKNAFKSGPGSEGGFFSDIFNSLGGGIKSIGASLANVGSNGPLAGPAGLAIVFGIPALLGAISALLNVFLPLVNVILLLPAALGVLAAAIIPVTLAFGGLSNAIGAVESGDPEKIAEAFKAISPAARKLATDLAEVIGFIKIWKLEIQEAFFKPISNSNGILRLWDSIGWSVILPGMVKVAAAAGQFAANLVYVAENPSVQKFLSMVFESASNFWTNLSPGINALLVGLSNLGIATLPYVDMIVQKLSDLFAQFGYWLTKISINGEVDQFMAKLKTAFDELMQLAGSTWNLASAIIGPTGESDKAKDFLQKLIDTIDKLTEFFKSDVGQVSLRGMIDLAEIFLFVLGTIIAGWALLGFAVVAVHNFLTWIVSDIKAAYDWADRLFRKYQDLRSAAAFLAPGVNLLSKFMAEGGVVTGPTAAILGESGSEVVIPLTDQARATQLMTQTGLMNLAGSNGGAGNETPQVINVSVMIGQEQLNDIIDTRVTKIVNRIAQGISFGARPA